MTQQQNTPQVPMICATAALKTGPFRVGHLGGDFSLPRTVPITTLIVMGVTGFIGLIISLAAPGGVSVTRIFGGLIFGALVGYLLASYSPLKGESLMTWVGLQASTLRRQKTVRGVPVIVSIGVAELDREPMGKFRIQRRAVRVAPGRFDDRGVVVSAKNKNVPEGARVVGNHSYTGVPAVSGKPSAARRPSLGGLAVFTETNKSVLDMLPETASGIPSLPPTATVVNHATPQIPPAAEPQYVSESSGNPFLSPPKAPQ